MSDNGNWIKLNRCIRNNFVWSFDNPKFGLAWIDMLLMANYKDKKVLFDGSLETVERGSFITSMVKLSERWNMNRKTVKRFLDMLQDEQMITYEATKRWTTIRIVNYLAYQGFADFEQPSDGQVNGQQKDNQTDNEGTTDWTQHKKEKKEKKEKNINKSYSDDPELNAALVSFVEFRKKMKKPMTDHAIKLLISKLNGMTTYIPEQIEILNQSIVNGWQGIFPLKDNQPVRQGGYQKQTKAEELNEFYAMAARWSEED